MSWLRQWTNPESATFALRLALALLLTWTLSLLMDSRSTGTAMMTAAIIQITGSSGASFKKSLARFTGTIVGGIYIVLVASVTLIDAWLYNSFIILGIVVSLGIASYFHRRISYMFAVVGITLSLAGFPVATDANMSSLFDHVQLRCVAISFGILMSMIAGFIIPYADDAKELRFIKSLTQKFIDDIFVAEESKVTKLVRGFLSLVSKKWLAVDDEIYGSSASKEHKDKRRSAFYDCINLAVQAIELRKLGDALGLTQDAWQELKRQRFNLNDTSDFVSHFELSEYELLIEKAFEFSKNLDAFNNKETVFDYSQRKYINNIDHFTDGYLVLNNMFRATLALFLLSFMWIELQWSDGMGAIIMAGMVISVFAANPGAEGVFSPNIYAQFVAGAFAFFVNFVVMPIGSPVLTFAIGFIGYYVMAYWFWQSKSLLKIVLMVSLFSWSNMVPLGASPSFDFAHFLNTLVANLVGLFALWIGYQIVPSRKTSAVVKKRFMQLISRLKNKSPKEEAKINVNNLVLSSYSYLTDESDKESVFTLLYTKALVRLLEEEKVDGKERELLLSTLDSGEESLKTNKELMALMDSRYKSGAKLNYNWFNIKNLLVS
ncbi:FUSC family protein [Vibrio inusitatus]|nr:FUSC family protein [Vibrio inusitatus]